MVSADTWKSFSDDMTKALYQSLCWYYTPMPLDAGTQELILPVLNGKRNVQQKRSVFSRRAPLQNAYWNASTEAYLTDGQDQVQILEGVASDKNYKTAASCTGSLAGWGGVMPEVDGTPKYYMPTIEDSKTPVDQWWPAYTDPNPDLLAANPGAQQAQDRKCCSGGCDTTDTICTWCTQGGICVNDPKQPTQYKNLCSGGIIGAFASAFPASPMGPVWEMGAEPCDADELDFDGSNPKNPTKQPAIAESCIKKLFMMDPTKPLLGQSPDLTDAWKNNRTSAKFQMVNIIQPYARKQGCPSFGFMEGVAYVLEGLGKSLLNAPSCRTGMDPGYVAAFSRTAWCTDGKRSRTYNRQDQKAVVSELVGCDPSDMKGCKANIDQWKVASGISPSDTVEMFQAPAHSERGHSESTMLTASSGAKCTGCCFSTTSNALLKPEDDVSVLDKSQRDAYALSSENGVCVQNPDLGAECTGSKIMFYWMNGYGKFLNMGLTAIYANYLGAFLTVPNQPWSATDPSKGPFLRRSADQLQGMGMSAGASQQYDMFTSGDSTLSDKRPYLTGYCTTFQYGSPFQKGTSLYPGRYSSVTGKVVPYKYDFEATKEDYNTHIIITSGRMVYAKKWGPHVLPDKTQQTPSVWKNGKVDPSCLVKTTKNDWYGKDVAYAKNFSGGMAYMQSPPGVANCQGLQNPQEGIVQYVSKGTVPVGGDQRLCEIACNTVQCYYPPGLGIENPNYRKQLKEMSPDAGRALWSAMYINGDSGADWYGYNSGSASCAQVSQPSKCPAWPFGTYYFAANLGCIYGLTAALGLNSSQFSVMSTGGGGAKACDYPNYDYEIVYIGGRNIKNRVCTNTVKTDKGYDDDVYGFKLLDFTSGGDKNATQYYIDKNYVQGSTQSYSDQISDLIACIDNKDGFVFASPQRKQAFQQLFAMQNVTARYKDDAKNYNQTPFSTCMMPLNEMNVHAATWKDNRPNALFYDEPQGKCPPATKVGYSAYQKCEAAGGTASEWPFGATNSGASDCPYRDGYGGMREESQTNKTTGLFTKPVQ